MPQGAIDGSISLQTVDGTRPNDKVDLPQLRETLKDLSKAETNNQIELGELLTKAFELSAHRDWGFPTWEDFIEQEMAMSKRKAQYLMSIHQWFVEVLKSKKLIDSVKHLGWSKLRLLKGVADATNIKEWLARAEQMSFSQLEAFIKQLKEDGKEKGEGNPENLTSVNFRLYEEQNRALEDALELAKDMAESDKRGHCLALICEDFMASNRFNMRPGQRMMELYLTKIANVLDVNLVASNRTNEEFIIGKKLVQDQALALPQIEKKALVKRCIEEEQLALLSKADRKALWERLGAEFA